MYFSSPTRRENDHHGRTEIGHGRNHPWGYDYEARYMLREDPLWLLLSLHQTRNDEPIRSVHLEGRAVAEFLYDLSLVLTALREGAAAHT